MYELSHKLLNNLGLMILENEERLRLFTWVFTDLMILVDSKSWLVDSNS